MTISHTKIKTNLTYQDMKVLYPLLVLSFPLMNGLFNNNTDSINTSICQCTCHNPYLEHTTGDNLCASARSYVDYHKILKIFDRNKILVLIILQ